MRLTSKDSQMSSVEEAEVVATHGKSHLQQAEELWEEGSIDPAIAKMRIAIQENPSDFEIREKLGDMYLSINKYEESVKEYTSALRQIDIYQRTAAHGQNQEKSQHQAEKEEAIVSGQIELETGNKKISGKNLSEIELNEWRSYILVKRGEAQQRLKKLDNAEADYKRALKFNKNCLEAHVRLGNFYMEEGYIEFAETHFKEAGKLISEKKFRDDFIAAEINYGTGITLLAQQKLVEARPFFEAAIKTDKTYAPAYFKLGESYQKNKGMAGRNNELR